MNLNLLPQDAPTGEPINLLIVDDIQENLIAMEALLRRDALNILLASSGAQALELLQRGCVTGASHRNLASYGAEVRFAEGLAAHWQPLLTDPQTSGGLLVSCAPEAVDAVLACFHDAGFGQAAVVGRLSEGAPGVSVR